MPKFKDNHTIPCCFIKEWAVEGTVYSGAHVYEYTRRTWILWFLKTLFIVQLKRPCASPTVN